MGREQSEKQKALSERQAVARELDGIVKGQEEIGAGTGVERAVRWTGRHPAPGATAGNAANAAAVGAASAGAVSLLYAVKAYSAYYVLGPQTSKGCIQQISTPRRNCRSSCQ